jgi:hypothetical protein
VTIPNPGAGCRALEAGSRLEVLGAGSGLIAVGTANDERPDRAGRSAFRTGIVNTRRTNQPAFIASRAAVNDGDVGHAVAALRRFPGRPATLDDQTGFGSEEFGKRAQGFFASIQS